MLSAERPFGPGTGHSQLLACPAGDRACGRAMPYREPLILSG
jgi:hypothetical protein